MRNHIDTEGENRVIENRNKLLGSLLYFTKVFFKIRTGRDFIISNPVGRESHHIVIAREFTNIINVKTKRLIINVAPGSGKSELCRHFIAWSLARHPDSNFIYISYSHERAESNTAIVKEILSLPQYKKLFNIGVHPDFSARDNFKILISRNGMQKIGGTVVAFGSGGSITGADAGLPGLNRFSGAAIMDDMHKPDEVFSDTSRNAVINNYNNTIVHRLRGHNVPLIFIGQRLHEEDLPSYFINKDKNDWKKVILKTVDDAGNILYPEVFKKEEIEALGDYEFAAQHQQNPIPSGGGIFKKEWFDNCELDKDPDIFATAITIDTAETTKSYNDATVFNFWGVYKVKIKHTEIQLLAIHSLNCIELRVEPADLEEEFLDFYSNCCRYPVPPECVFIEKKSTGVTLSSVLKRAQGLRIEDIERTRSSGNKTSRYIEMQPYIKKGLLTFTKGKAHNQMCIDHLCKITDNNSHAHDDVCFSKGTKIATLFGYKKIEDITSRDIIITPFGLGKVVSCGLTKRNCFVTKYNNLIATPNHKIFCNHRFAPISSLTSSDKIDIFSFKNLFVWRYKKLLYSMQYNEKIMKREDLISVNQEISIKEKLFSDFLFRIASIVKNKGLLKTLLFIIRTVRSLVEILAIMSVFRLVNACCFTRNKMGCESTISFSGDEILQKHDVYNLTVKDYGVYYAEDILVSNCDTFYDAIKSALIDKVIIGSRSNQQSNKNNRVINSLAKSHLKLIEKRRSGLWQKI